MTRLKLWLERIENRIALFRSRRLINRTLRNGNVRDIECLMDSYASVGLGYIAERIREKIHNDPAGYVLQRDSFSWQVKIR